jgi:hypothetical protein
MLWANIQHVQLLDISPSAEVLAVSPFVQDSRSSERPLKSWQFA